MKITAFLLVVASLSFAAESSSQITLHEKNGSLAKVFKQIKKQTGFNFLCTYELLQKANSITVDLDNVSMNKALDECLKNSALGYQIIDKTVVIKSKAGLDQIEATLPATITVKGVVKNDAGENLVGISVAIKGTKNGTTTDQNGFYSLEKIDENAILVFSGLNLESQEIKLNGRTSLNITLKIKISVLDEVQLIAYGQTTKRLKTSAISTIKAEDIEKQPVTNPVQALQGRVAGVSVTQTGGAIGSNMAFQIRGINSIQSGTQPLVILDGAIINPPTSGNSGGVGGYLIWGGTPLNAINPSDIESIDILKDADATSIYGSRGANGVVIITTKKGKAGNTKVTVDINTGMNKAINLAPLMNLSSYLKLRRNAFALGNNSITGAINPIIPTAGNAPDLVSWDTTTTTADWSQFEFGNHAPTFNTQVKLSGGTKKLNFYSSLGYFKQHDITRGNPFQERISGNLNVNHISDNNRLTVTINSNFISDRLFPSRGAVQVAGGLIQFFPSNMPRYNADGSPWWPAGTIQQNGLIYNPDAPENATQSIITNSFIGSLDLSYKILKGLIFKTQFAYNYSSINRESTLPSTAISPINPGTLVTNSTTSLASYQSFNVEPQLTYTNKISRGKIDLLVGGTFFNKGTKSNDLRLDSYSSDLLLNSWAAAANVTARSSTNSYYRFFSVFGRANYTWDDKYLANLTYRRDGSSRFGPKNQWADFGSVGLGWIFTNEQWMKNRIPGLSFGKIRGSFGSSGNDNIADYRWTSLYTATSIWYNGNSGLAPNYLSDSAISWESSKKTDAAIELGFLNDRIYLNVNWFRTKSTNLLADYGVPSTTGFASYVSNIPAVVQNKGWEFELTSNNFKPGKKFQWKTTFNLTLLKNELLSFPNLSQSSFANKLRVGLPVNTPGYPNQTEWTLKYLGVDTATGLPKFLDKNGDGAISSADYDYVGSAMPRTFGGLGNTFSYKNFSLDIFLQFSQQLGTNWLYGGYYPGQLSNVVTEWEDNYWTKPGDNKKYPRPFSGVAGTNTNLMTTYFNYSDAALVDLFYVRLKNISLTYTIPTKITEKAGISKASIYFRGQNLGTWTNHKIYKDPELIWLRSGMMTSSYTMGLQLNF